MLTVAHETRPVFVPQLTPAERHVIDNLARGMTYAEVASALGVALNTVKSHIQHVFAKLGVHDRHTAVYHVTGVAKSDRLLRELPVEAPLTSRQRDVLAHAAAGMTNREIANALFISMDTVKSHLQLANKALRTSGRRAAVAAASSYELKSNAA